MILDAVLCVYPICPSEMLIPQNWYFGKFIFTTNKERELLSILLGKLLRGRKGGEIREKNKTSRFFFIILSTWHLRDPKSKLTEFGVDLNLQTSINSIGGNRKAAGVNKGNIWKRQIANLDAPKYIQISTLQPSIFAKTKAFKIILTLNYSK